MTEFKHILWYFEDRTQPSAEDLLRRVVLGRSPFYTARGAKHGDRWCWFCGRQRADSSNPESVDNHRDDCDWLSALRLLGTEDLL